MANRTRVVIGGVDTHDPRPRRHGRLCSVGVEGTGTYGAVLTRFLLGHGV
jgi:hypothetical protein